MATVYLADDIKHGRQVALKVLRPELAATMGPERFFREIQVAARLQHPHILPLHDSGEADGFLFFVMPFVTGESLRERLDRVNELPVADVVRILTEVADALSYSHSQGVVHRDIKPDNVMLSGRHALVTDFGVAKAVSDAKSNSTVTTAGVALGTPTYMAPEQAAADPQLDHRVDIYALGVMGYEMLAGRPPFTGMPPQQMLLAHVTTPPQPVRTHRPACPPELEAVIMRCLAKRAADRFQSAEEIVQAIEPLSVSSGGITPTQTRPTPAVVTEPVVPVRRSRAPVYAAIAAVVAASIAAVAWISSKDGDASGTQAYERVQLTASGRVNAPSLSPDGQRFAFGERACNDEGQCTIDLRIQDVNGAGGTTLLSGMGALQLTEWSKDGRWLAFLGSVNGRWGQYFIPSLGGQPRFVGCCAMTMSTDGRSAVLIGPPAESDSVQVARWFNIEDGAQRDSLAFAPSEEVFLGIFEIDGSTNVVTLGVGYGHRLLLIDRKGVVLDSLPPPDGRIFAPPIRTVEGGLIVSILNEPNGELDIVRLSVGERFGDQTPLARRLRVSGPSHVSHSGDVLVMDGSPEFSLWALERPSIESNTFTARRVAQSTAGLTGSIMPSGDTLLVSQSRPTDPRVADFSLVPFAGAGSRILGPQQLIVDWDFEQEGRGLLLGKLSGRRLEMLRLDLNTNQSTPLITVPGDRLATESVAGGGFVQAGVLNQVAAHRLPNRADTVFTIPGVSTIAALEPSPDGREVAVAGWDAVGQRMVFSRLALADGKVAEIWRMPAEGFDAITWLPDNTLLFSIGETQWTNAWYRLPVSGGPPRRQDIQLSNDASHRFARSGLRGVARERILRADVFLLRGLNVLSGR